MEAKEMLMIRRPHRLLLMAAMVAAPTCVPSLVEATTRSWLTGSGQWQTASNWVREPGAADW